MNDRNRVDDAALCEPFETNFYDSRESLPDHQTERHGWFSDPYEGSHRKADAVLAVWFLAAFGSLLLGWMPLALVLVGSLILTLLVGTVAVLVGITSRL